MTSVRRPTAPNLCSDAPHGVTYAYRRFGNTGTTRPPLLCLQHYRGTLDNWDPLFIDAVAEHGEVILLDNAGVGGSTGTLPRPAPGLPGDATVSAAPLAPNLAVYPASPSGGLARQSLPLPLPGRVVR